MQSSASRSRPVCFAATCGAALALLAGCGSKPQEPVEQVIVRAPGAAVTGVSAKRAEPAPTADLATKGKAAFAITCLGCHAVDAGAAGGPGPNLHGVVGRKAGLLAGFAYSDALQTSGLIWSAAALNAFIADPVASVPGTTMAIGGVRDAATRKAIIAYLAAPPR